MTSPLARYPDIEVELSSSTGNAFALMGRVASALRAHGVDRAEIDEFRREAMSDDYDHLLRTCMRWVAVS